MRGLKFGLRLMFFSGLRVAPLAGAWIEIPSTPFLHPSPFVAPLAGAWIEICYVQLALYSVNVAPLAGAWIEIPLIVGGSRGSVSRTPRGCVD